MLNNIKCIPLILQVVVAFLRRITEQDYYKAYNIKIEAIVNTKYNPSIILATSTKLPTIQLALSESALQYIACHLFVSMQCYFETRLYNACFVLNN